ncbi:MAG: hypothetical protein CVU60_04780 [Deltaproteobacteria bacterium HGW-Deltaproteobacteria-18]|jgi:HPt (histidine-containing phosphotransfer) domain-containing protein|nr:MAG: hypothetical protein CVU60_04780 [Deltaproteobacteria bacterium HGW-Deltaproteobacteria-18]
MTAMPPNYLPGIDIAEGMERFSGNWETYFRIMKYFVKSHESIMADLNGVLSQGSIDFNELAEVAHKIKGAAANLSAVEIRHCAMKLEQSSKAQDIVAVRTDIPNILNSYYELRDVIENM